MVNNIYIEESILLPYTPVETRNIKYDITFLNLSVSSCIMSDINN